MFNTKLKKIITVLLATATILAFTACSEREPAESEQPSSSQPSQSQSSEPEPEVDPSVPVTPEQTVIDQIDAAQEINTDVKGWIKIPGTEIDNELLQADDNIYYERRDITKADNWYGCYFLDAGNVLTDRTELTQNTIIYGHNMDDDPNGEKFAQLMNFENIEFAEKTPYIYIYTDTDEMVFEVFSAFFTDINFQYHLENPGDEMIQYIIDEGKERSVMIYDVEATAEDKILTLSTCTYRYGSYETNKDQRFVIQAKLIPAGSELKEEAYVIENPTPKQPVF